MVWQTRKKRFNRRGNEMKKSIKTIIVGLSVVALGLVLTACGNKNKSTAEKINLAVILQNTANAAPINTGDRSSVFKEVSSAITGGQTIQAVIADGKPFVVTNTDLNQVAIDSNLKTPGNLVGMAKHSIGKMQTTPAKTEGVDILGALRLASELVNNSGLQGKKEIVIASTGISTISRDGLDFQKNIINLTPQDIVKQLEAKADIPKLDGIHVIWQQTDVAAPQVAPTQEQVKKIIAIYRAIVVAGHGTFDEVERPSDSTVKPNAKLPKVPTVIFPPDSVIAGPDVTSVKQPIVLPDSEVQFRPTSSDFVDETKASNYISQVAQVMKNNLDKNFLLAGTVAGDAEDDSPTEAVQLSLERANKVKDKLITDGIPASRLSTLGTGFQNPWHIPGVGFTGAGAEANRSVVIMDSSSSIAQQLLGH